MLYLLDPDVAPPENFQWFFQTGGDSSRRKFTMDACITRDSNGNVLEVEIYNPHLRFDSKDPRTANTWAVFTDKNGQQHKTSADFFFNHSNSDLYNVGSLLQFGTDRNEDIYTQANRFLANLQAYPKGYFSRFGISRSISLTV